MERIALRKDSWPKMRTFYYHKSNYYIKDIKIAQNQNFELYSFSVERRRKEFADY
jgi:hypothetical protein